MTYRNATYIAFAADGEINPIKSDLKYYNLLKARKELESTEFNFINAHEKVSAVRDTSKEETIKASLRKRMQSSKNMLLLIGKTTKYDTDFVPYEISYGINVCKLPIIVCYTEVRGSILNSIPNNLKSLWPTVLSDNIIQEKVKTIHIPFKESLIQTTINDFSIYKQPPYSVTLYTEAVYRKHGL